MGRRLYASGAANRERLPHTVLAHLAATAATVGGAALLAVVSAHWFWRIAAPAPLAAPAAPWPETSAESLVAAPVFGRAGLSPPPETKSALTGGVGQVELRLLGVVAEADGVGQALFRHADRGPVLAGVGQEVVPGVRVEAVFADRVRLEGRGETREMRLRSPSPPASALAPPPATALAASAGCASPPGFKGPTFRINAELLSGMATQPESWTPLLGESPTGLVVRDGSGFAAMLGLRAGDRLREANGVPLSAHDDLLVAVVRPLQANQPVRVRGARQGGELELLLVNASACAPR